MKLLTDEIFDRLLKNGALRRHVAEEGLEGMTGIDLDFLPVVKLFTPDAGATWLISEIDPDDHDRGFGLADLGLGMPELGYFSLAELEAVRGPLGRAIERDVHFVVQKPLSAYAEEARRLGYIKA